MKVVEIFTSIDGEGSRTGLPATFIRLYGCNLKCSYCDTRYGCEGNNYNEMSINDILLVVQEGPSNITLTGGEPLLHNDVQELIYTLNSRGYIVNVETNGSIPIPKYRYGNEFYTVDYKSIFSKMNKYMKIDNFKYLYTRDVLKFVVATKQDLDDMKNFLSKLKPNCQIYVSPVFEEIEPKEIVEYILENRLYNVKVQVQLHKIIWDPNKKGV